MTQPRDIIATFNKEDKYYTIRTTPGFNLVWLENEEGEGMQLHEEAIFDVLHKYFKETF